MTSKVIDKQELAGRLRQLAQDLEDGKDLLFALFVHKDDADGKGCSIVHWVVGGTLEEEVHLLDNIEQRVGSWLDEATEHMEEEGPKA